MSNKKETVTKTVTVSFWQGQKDLNPRHAVLETAALPTELYPYVLTSNNITDYYEKSKCFFIFIYHKNKKPPKRLFLVGQQGLEPRTDRL